MSKKPGLHVLFLTPGFPKDEADTACVTGIQTYVKALIKARPEVKISVISTQYPRVKKLYEWRGVEVHALGRPDFRTIRKFFTQSEIYKAIEQVHKEEPIDVIHSFWLGECALIGQKMEKKHGIRHLCTAMGQEMVGVNVYARLIRLKTLQLVCQSAFQSKMASGKLGIQNAHIIPFGLDTTGIGPLEVQPRNIDLLFVGNINENKNLTGFLEVMSDLKKQFENLNATIIGDHFLEIPVADLIERHGLTGHATYLGKVPNHTVLQHMARAKVLVHTSFFEAGALVFMEALMQGMYVVSREVGLVQKQDRWKIAESNEAFVQAISELLRSDLHFERSMPYGIERTVEEYTTLYQSLLA